MLFDSHAHLNFQEFENDWRQIIDDCQKQNVWVANVGSQFETSKKAVEISNNFEVGVYAAVGLHPIHVLGSKFHPEKFDREQYRQLIEASKKIVAIGETGIDFFHDDKNFEKQKEIFIEHINLAQAFNLPVVIHARNSRDGKKNAYQEIIKVIRDQRSEIRGVIHCFGGTKDEAMAFIKLGFCVGFTGVITFDQTEQLAETIDQLSLDSILVETDSPYLAPVPFRGKRNQPQYVRYVVEKIAQIKKIDYNKIAEQTAINTKKLFRV